MAAILVLPLAKIGVAGLPWIGKAVAIPLIAAVGIPAAIGGAVGAAVTKIIE